MITFDLRWWNFFGWNWVALKCNWRENEHEECDEDVEDFNGALEDEECLEKATENVMICANQKRASWVLVLKPKEGQGSWKTQGNTYRVDNA